MDIIIKSSLITSAISFFISAFSTKGVYVGSSISGYITLCIFFICTIYKASDIFSVGPYIITMVVSAIMIALLFMFKKDIIQGQISSSYFLYSNVTIILILLQLYIASGTTDFAATATVTAATKLDTYIMYLLGLFMIISTIIITILLKYYRTDGFTLKGKMKKKLSTFL